MDATERGNEIVFRMRGANSVEISSGRLVEEDGPAITITRTDMESADVRVRLRFVDAEADHAPGLAVSAGAAEAAVVEVEAAVEMDRDQAQRCADALARQIALQVEQARFALAADGMAIEAGDVVTLDGVRWRIVGVSHGPTTTFEAVRTLEAAEFVLTSAAPVAPLAPLVAIEPDVAIVDAPPLPGEEDDARPIGFAFVDPWVGRVVFSAGSGLTLLGERGVVERPCMMGHLVSGLYPHVSGRWQEASVWVRVSGDGPSSRSEAAVLGGANVAFVETEAGWELLQFLEAELVDVETYRLSGLLRGQQGSESAMAAGAPVGARIVFRTGAEQRLQVADWERGLELQWRAGRESGGVASAWSSSLSHEDVASRAWSPAHLAANWVGGDLSLNWIRRARKGGDPWVAGQPGHEWPEGYRVRVSGGVSSRQWDVMETSTTYPASQQVGDFPAGGASLIEVAQLGANGEPGAWTALEVAIPGP